AVMDPRTRHGGGSTSSNGWSGIIEPSRHDHPPPQSRPVPRAPPQPRTQDHANRPLVLLGGEALHPATRAVCPRPRPVPSSTDIEYPRNRPAAVREGITSAPGTPC